jgi:protein involved in polysaccharide export with SLBB domain
MAISSASQSRNARYSGVFLSLPLTLRATLALLICALSAGLLACGSNAVRPGPLPSSLPPVPVEAESPYRIQPGDELEIRFFHTPDQNLTLPVRPDGFISLPLVYEVRAAGRTAEELRRELVERCSKELAEPEIAVIVRSFTGYFVHVGGEVMKPGVLQLSGSRTVLQAVFEAGGFKPTASPLDAFVVRRTPEGTHTLVTANLAAVLTGESGDGNFLLQPYDIVVVPTSPIADVNKFIDQYVRENIPISFTIGYRVND